MHGIDTIKAINNGPDTTHPNAQNTDWLKAGVTSYLDTYGNPGQGPIASAAKLESLYRTHGFGKVNTEIHKQFNERKK